MHIQKGLDHREKGERSVGKAIWSPVESKSGQDIYKNMVMYLLEM